MSIDLANAFRIKNNIYIHLAQSFFLDIIRVKWFILTSLFIWYRFPSDSLYDQTWSLANSRMRPRPLSRCGRTRWSRWSTARSAWPATSTPCSLTSTSFFSRSTCRWWTAGYVTLWVQSGSMGVLGTGWRRYVLVFIGFPSNQLTVQICKSVQNLALQFSICTL